jgi:hypothetical protein
MDRVKFGRALGQGTRDAARALLKAADAATAPNPSPRLEPRPQPRPETTLPRVAIQTVQKVRTTQRGVQAGSRNFIQATTAPIVKASGILWLEVTGSIFALFAAASAIEIYRHRAGLQAAGDDRRNLILAAIMFALFAAFTVSNFVRAHRKSQSP